MSEITINGALRRLGYAKHKMTGHGFRSAASTLLHERGLPHAVIERQLAHGDGPRNARNLALFRHRDVHELAQQKEPLNPINRLE